MRIEILHRHTGDTLHTYEASSGDQYLIRSAVEDAAKKGVSLRGADLSAAVLLDAVLLDAVLREADLREADLRDAVLLDADLSGAVLREADLRNADLSGADLPSYQIPQEGGLVVWKACKGRIVKLRIPPTARRTASLVGRKCRAEHAWTVAIYDRHGAELDEAESLRGAVYRVGGITYPDGYDGDPRVECTHGIHFFLTREEAERSGF